MPDVDVPDDDVEEISRTSQIQPGLARNIFLTLPLNSAPTFAHRAMWSAAKMLGLLTGPFNGKLQKNNSGSSGCDSDDSAHFPRKRTENK